jgi:mRNA interferase RelE/StbE
LNLLAESNFHPHLKYSVTLKPKAEKDLSSMAPVDRLRMIDRLRMLGDDLSGDVKKLTNFDPEYRMRSGNWRALFEVDGDRVIVYRILHRKDSYR